MSLLLKMIRRALGRVRPVLSSIRSRTNGEEVATSGWVDVERRGFTWRVRADSYIGGKIVRTGVFEPDTTAVIERRVEPGMHVMDVGANFGYFTLLMARLVGPTGHVWAFEPTSRYRRQLEWHLERNGLASRVTVCDYGLSDTSETLEIVVGSDSASFYGSLESATSYEIVQLRALDDVAGELGLYDVGFVKVDIDGHEPRFLRGASRFLCDVHPPMVIEFAQHSLHVAGSDVREQARLLRDLGYVICDQKTLQPYSSEMKFLMDCGNFDRSCNALVTADV